MEKGRKEGKESTLSSVSFPRTRSEAWKGLEDAESVLSKLAGSLEDAFRPLKREEEEELKPESRRFGPAAGMGVGFGVGAGVALVGCTALEPTTSFTRFKLVFGIGAGFGVGIGYGFGIGVGRAWKPSELLGGNHHVEEEKKQ